jgi:hypothetical protein
MECREKHFGAIMNNPPLSIYDVSAPNIPRLNLSRSPFVPSQGKLVDADPILLAHWALDNRADITASAYLISHQFQGQNVVLAEIVFFNLTDGYPLSWRTYRIEFPGNQYNEDYTDEIKEYLKRELVSLEH